MCDEILFHELPYGSCPHNRGVEGFIPEGECPFFSKNRCTLDGGFPQGQGDGEIVDEWYDLAEPQNNVFKSVGEIAIALDEGVIILPCSVIPAFVPDFFWETSRRGPHITRRELMEAVTFGLSMSPIAEVLVQPS